VSASRRAFLRALVAVPAASALSGCGYALVGRGTVIDPSIKRIGIPNFKDQTGKEGLDLKLTQHVIEELMKRGKFDVVQDATGVDALVDGQILAYEARPVGIAGRRQAQEASRYSIVLKTKVAFTKTGQAEPIFSNDAFTAREEFDIGDDPTQHFDREEQALERLSANYGRNLVAAMLEAF